MHPIRIAVRALGAAALSALVATSLPVLAARADAPPATGPALDLANLDRTCRACDDFFQYATGGWQKSHTIPAGFAEYGAFGEVYEHNLSALHGILDDAAKTGAAASSDTGRIGTYYAACNDQAAIEKNGIAPLKPELDRIAALATTNGIVDEMGRLARIGVDTGLSLSSETDQLDSAKTIASINYGGLGMPDRDYYLAAQNAAIRTAYKTYLVTQLSNLGESANDAGTHADAIIALETVLAKATPPNADLRDPKATYHPMGVAQLNALAPHVAWTSFLAGYGENGLTSVDVNLPQFEKALDEELAAVPIDVWKAYFRTHLVTSFARALPKAFDDASFAFYSTALRGVKQQMPRWKRCVAATDAALPDPLGKAYVAKEFSPSAKARALNMVDNLQRTLHDDIATLPWMSPATRREAETKLAAYTKKIGYPDTWIDYSPVVLTPGDAYAADVIATREYATTLDLAKIGKPTNRALWGMSPPTVNAYYNPQNNEIVFPAGILQPPFFNATADDAVIYGAIGAVIGHEMTHGFDDQGRQFDAQGNFRDWWTAADAKAFAARAQCIVDEFNGFEVAPGVHENGRLIQGEAIADLGGTTIAYKAFMKTAQYKAHKKIDGLTPEQRFFISYAQAWRELLTPQSAKQAVLVDPHPENKFRLIGTLSNMPEFRRAFACAANDKMVRAHACQIW